MLLVAFGIKAGVSLVLVASASYHTPPHVVTAFSALLTKVGVYALIRTMTLIFRWTRRIFSPFFSVAGLTMVTGVLGAVSSMICGACFRFTLSARSVTWCSGWRCSAGGLAATIFFLVHVMAAKAALFVVGALAHYLRDF